MLNIGIISLFCDKRNYGGTLQAYALCRVLNDMGYTSEQIMLGKYSGFRNIDLKVIQKKPSILRKILKPLKPIYRAIKKIELSKREKLKEKWREVFGKFNEKFVPCSKREYNEINMSDTLSIYDVFITGSDQVWNPIWYFEPFFLTFVSNGAPKLSYAASISQKELSPKAKSIYKENLKDFFAISVREKEAVELIQDISPVKVEYVLDPTMLLSAEQWDDIVSERIINEKYLFCYFLSDDKNMRNVAKKYANEHGLKIVNIKHATGEYHANDKWFANYNMDAPPPNDFLSYIKYSDVVFTDSFHATVFSILYKKQFFVFTRPSYNGMETRIASLMNIFEIKNRFFDINKTINIKHLNEVVEIDYSKEFDKFEYMKTVSMNYLKSNLEKIKKVRNNEN